MILPWSQLEPALSAMFKRLSNLPATAPPDASGGIKALGSRQGEMKIASNLQQVDLEFAVISDVGIGEPELRQHYDADIPYPGDTYVDPDAPTVPLGTVIVELNQNHQVVIQVTVASGLQKTNAYDYAGVLRARVRLPSALDELRAMGLALAGVGQVYGPIPELDPNFRDVGKYAFEMTCNGMSYAIDTPQTTIETADISTTVDT